MTPTSKNHRCPVEVTLDILGGKWRALVIWHLSQETLRFSELRRRIPAISEKVLQERLSRCPGRLRRRCLNQRRRFCRAKVSK